MIRLNISTDLVRKLDVQKKAILKDIGDALAEQIWTEFEVLVNETPQYTGTTAASWNLLMHGRGLVSAVGSEVRKQKNRSAKTALSKGHSHAVDIALAKNRGRLNEISTDYRYKDITIINAAPGAEVAEEGPVRPVNSPAHALARFMANLESKTATTIKSRVI